MGDDRLFSGVIAPVLTPYDANLDPDPARFADHAAWLLEDGCTGLAPFGTTGEALSLGLVERRRLLDALLEAGIDPARLMPGTGLCSIPDTVELCRHAVGAGCGGVMVLPPFYFKGASDDGVFEHFREVIDRIADARLRVYLYHIPPQAVIGFPVDLVGRLIDAYPGVVVGLKDSSGDWSYSEALLAAYPGFRVLSAAPRRSFSTTSATVAAAASPRPGMSTPGASARSTTPGRREPRTPTPSRRRSPRCAHASRRSRSSRP